jgi:histidinol dehydrogenase
MTTSVSSVSTTFRFSGDLSALTAEDGRLLFDRSTTRDTETTRIVGDIIERVRVDGDDALFSLARDLDHVALDRLEVQPVILRDAFAAVDPRIIEAMRHAARNIECFHRALMPEASCVEVEAGVTITRRPDPLGRVGVYAPGGRALYPSSVLMGAIPARVAGVKEVILCSPPASDGIPAAVVLAAAEIAGVHRVFAVGGAGAIAAMALGTASVPRVDKIVGPGNAFVAEAKAQLADVVAFDSPAGPTEVLVIADDTASPDVVAREVVAQAEHDVRAIVLVLAIGPETAARIEAAILDIIDSQPRRNIVCESLNRFGGVLSVDDVAQAIEAASRFAPEHLLVATRDPMAVADRIRNAGAIFLGETSSVSFGDYITGGNHVLPTGGLAKSYSGLSTSDFIRWTMVQGIDASAAARLASDTAVFAEAEGLHAHAAAARAWGGSGVNPGTRRMPRPSLELGRALFRQVSLYEPAAVPCRVDLSDNTNLWGAPPSARTVLENAETWMLTRYPAPYARGLNCALAAYLGVEPEMVVSGCGSDDILDSAIRAFAEPGDQLAHLDPTFGMISVFSTVNGISTIGVSRNDPSPAAALVASGARLIYLCSPNNPTGEVLDPEFIESVVASASGLVIVDEAYAEFSGVSSVGLLARHENLLITRTLSKAFGLAGLRIGYAAGAPRIVAEVEKSRGPYKVSSIGERTAIAALTSDREWVNEKVSAVRGNRESFGRRLQSIGLEPLDSGANFVLVPVADATRTRERLAASGVAVRAFESLPGIGDALRITIGPWPMMEECLVALEAAVQ